MVGRWGGSSEAEGGDCWLEQTGGGKVVRMEGGRRGFDPLDIARNPIAGGPIAGGSSAG